MKSEVDIPIPPPRKTWPFANSYKGECWKYPIQSEYGPALKYAHMIGSRKGWKFRGRWYDDYGLIWRVL